MHAWGHTPHRVTPSFLLPCLPTHPSPRVTTRHHASPRVTTPHHPAPPLAKVVYTESPANPTCRLTDLEAVGALVTEWAQKTGNKKPWVMCDATFATPFHQRCLEVPAVDTSRSRDPLSGDLG